MAIHFKGRDHKFVKIWNTKTGQETLHRIDCGVARRSMLAPYTSCGHELFDENDVVPIFRRHPWIVIHSCLNGYKVIDGALVHAAEKGE